MEKLSLAFVLVTGLIAVAKCLRQKRRVYVAHSLNTQDILVGGRQWWETAPGYCGRGMSLPAHIREDEEEYRYRVTLYT